MYSIGVALLGWLKAEIVPWLGVCSGYTHHGDRNYSGRDCYDAPGCLSFSNLNRLNLVARILGAPGRFASGVFNEVSLALVGVASPA